MFNPFGLLKIFPGFNSAKNLTLNIKTLTAKVETSGLLLRIILINRIKRCEKGRG
jgi:hypothetical protein